MKMPIGMGVLLAGLALVTTGCSGFGTTCSKTADCPSGSSCDPNLQVCFVNTTVTAIAPANGTINVPTASAVVTATFSNAVLDGGVTNETFSLDGQGFNTPGDYVASASAKQETFVPFAGRLALGTQYTVNLTNGIHDIGGQSITPFSSTFTTQDGAWQADVPYLSPTSTSTGDYAVANNFYGDVVAGFDNQLLPTTSSDYSFIAGVAPGGSPPSITQTVYSVAGDEVYGPSLSIGNSGRAIAAFNVNHRVSGSVVGFSVKASVYDPAAASWGAAVDLPVPASQAATGVQVVSFQNGDGLALWTQTTTTTTYQVLARAYAAASGWASQVVTVQGDTTVSCDSISLSTDLDANVLAAWRQGSPAAVFTAYRPQGGSFGTPAATSSGTHPAFSPAVALGYYGFGGVAWYEDDGTSTGHFHVFAAAFDPTANPKFGTVTQLDTASSADTPSIGAAANGDLMVVWEEFAAAGGSISASTYSSSSGTWSAPQLLYSNATTAPFGAVVTVDPGGNAVAVWSQPVGTSYLAFGRRFTVSGGWVPPLSQPATQLNFGTDGSFQSKAVVDGTGRVTVFAERASTTSYLDYIGFH